MTHAPGLLQIPRPCAEHSGPSYRACFNRHSQMQRTPRANSDLHEGREDTTESREPDNILEDEQPRRARHNTGRSGQASRSTQVQAQTMRPEAPSHQRFVPSISRSAPPITLEWHREQRPRRRTTCADLLDQRGPSVILLSRNRLRQLLLVLLMSWDRSRRGIGASNFLRHYCGKMKIPCAKMKNQC